MKRILIMSLAIISMCSFVACTNENNKNESNIEQVMENIPVMENEGVTEEEKEEEVVESEEEGKEENNIDTVIEESENEKENNYITHYEIVKEIVENKKMTIITSDNREIEAENGLGENIVYKLNDNNEIIISYSVKLTTILNDGNYDINGTVFSNILNEILNDDKYIVGINKAIVNYFNEEKETYTDDIDGVKVDINQDYDFVKVKIAI